MHKHIAATNGLTTSVRERERVRETIMRERMSDRKIMRECVHVRRRTRESDNECVRQRDSERETTE